MNQTFILYSWSSQWRAHHTSCCIGLYPISIGSMGYRTYPDCWGLSNEYVDIVDRREREIGCVRSVDVSDAINRSVITPLYPHRHTPHRIINRSKRERERRGKRFPCTHRQKAPRSIKKSGHYPQIPYRSFVLFSIQITKTLCVSHKKPFLPSFLPPL